VKNTPLLQLEKQDGFCVIDETLSTGQAGTCDLYIFLSADHALLVLRERSGGKFLAAENILPIPPTGKHFTDFIRYTVENSRLISLGVHRKVTVAINNTYASLLPSGLFRAGDEAANLRFTVSRDDLTACSEKVSAYDLQVIYGIQPEIKSLLQQLLPSCKIVHALSCALEYQGATYAGTKYISLRVLTYPGLLTIVVSDGKKLLFANAFEAHTAEEALYYLLNTCEQLDLDRSECRAAVCGAPAQVEALVAKANAYLTHVHATTDANIGSLSYKLKAIPGSSLLPALTVSLCE
jgi:hypothetical protein